MIILEGPNVHLILYNLLDKNVLTVLTNPDHPDNRDALNRYIFYPLYVTFHGSVQDVEFKAWKMSVTEEV